MEENSKINEVVEKVSQKYGYDEELKDTLKRIIPSMIKGKSEEAVQTLYDTLDRVKIFVLDEKPTEEDLKRCEEEIIGKANKHVKFLEKDLGEYGQGVAPGAYVTEPIFDDDMNIVDRKGFLYVSKLSKYSSLVDVYGTQINLSHLVHELGHAWSSQKDEFIQNEDGSYVNNVGACTFKYKVDREKGEVESTQYDGLLLEEALNTIEEEDILCDILNIDDIKELSSKGYVPSNYQGNITSMMRDYISKFGKEDFDKFRYLKDREALESIEYSLESTQAWEKMQTAEFEESKREKFARINELDVSDRAKDIINGIVQKYEDVYFPDNEKFTPMQKLENIFTQLYNFKGAMYNFSVVGNEHNLEIYKEIMTAILVEGYVPKNQADLEKVKEAKEKKTGFMQDLEQEVYSDKEVAQNTEERETNLQPQKEEKDKTVDENKIV